MSPSDDAEVRAILLRIASMLERGHEQRLALVVRKVLSGSTQTLEEFLKSNELWGGSGSMADSSLVGGSEERKELEELLIGLGSLQLKYGEANARTQGWVMAFEKWRQLDVGKSR